jgi:hypothetical protein
VKLRASSAKVSIIRALYAPNDTRTARAPYARASLRETARVNFIEALNNPFTLLKNSQLQRGLHDRINCTEIVGT